MGNEKLGQQESCCRYDIRNDRHHPDCPLGQAFKELKAPKEKGYNPKYDSVIDEAKRIVDEMMS